jgi:hypothetical protein
MLLLVVWGNHFGNLERKILKFIQIKSHLDISIMHPLGISFLTNTKNSLQKDFWE